MAHNDITTTGFPRRLWTLHGPRGEVFHFHHLIQAIRYRQRFQLWYQDGARIEHGPDSPRRS